MQVGENGSGKTTLLKLLLDDLSPTTGYRNANRRLKIGYFSQHHVDQLDMDISGIEVLEKRFPGILLLLLNFLKHALFHFTKIALL